MEALVVYVVSSKERFETKIPQFCYFDGLV